MTIRLAIDAENFAHDRRGMGRFARTVTAAAIADPELSVTLLSKRRSTADALRELFSHGAYAVKSEERASRRRAFDVCWFPWNGMRYRAAAPCAVTIHDTFAFSEPAKGRVARFREQEPMRRAARRAQCVFFDSTWSAREAAEYLDIEEQQRRVIPLAPDTYFSGGRPEVLPRELGAKRFVLFVGGREARKNAAMLFSACARALDPLRETLAIVGPIARTDEVRLRAYGTPHVRIEANDVVLRSLYRGAAVVAVPSRAEGFGLVAAEAMACGAAVIAANASALPEVCADAALLADPGDAGAWADAIRLLLDDGPLRHAFQARSAARWSDDRLSFVRETIASLKELAHCA